LVSVVIPVLNGESHDQACMTSVLGQTCRNIEVVVADQTSTDRSIEIVQSFADPRVRLLPNPTERLNLHANWTRGLSAARGELVKIVCQDDLLLPDCLSIQVELLHLYPSAILACGRRQILDAHGKVLIRARGLGHLAKVGSTPMVDGPTIARACTRAGTNLLGEPGLSFRRPCSINAGGMPSTLSSTCGVQTRRRGRRQACRVLPPGQSRSVERGIGEEPVTGNASFLLENGESLSRRGIQC
jgi:glycosyltransferase involved in cell wall biosynthesis